MQSDGRSVLEIVIAARERIADPARWTQGELARNAAGCSVNPCNGNAARWCAIGSIERECTGQMLYYSVRSLFNVQLAEINDRAGHAAVLAEYDRVIALLREREKA